MADPLGGGAGEYVRAWRPADVLGVVLMEGVVSSHRADPQGQYFIGLIGGRAMRLTRGRQSHVLRPGQLGLLDPSGPHTGSPAEGGPWGCRLLVIEVADLKEAAADPEAGGTADLWFPDPVLPDRALARRFAALHRDLAGPASGLERQSALTAWLQDAAAGSPSARRGTSLGARRVDHAAVRRARERIADDPAANVSLDELAAVAGVSKYRLVRLFRAACGVPPHAFQISLRVTRARRLLEQGVAPAAAAVLVGFHDQSHLHRHFRRQLCLTPGQYVRAFRASV
jgi:AraC-like DNA-binding protein